MTNIRTKISLAFLLATLLITSGCHNGRVSTWVVVENDHYFRNRPEPVVLEGRVSLSRSRQGCRAQTVSSVADLYKFDPETRFWVYVERLFVNSRFMHCPSFFDWSAQWSFDRHSDATTYEVRVRTNTSRAGSAFDTDRFVIWHSQGSPTGHAKRALQKAKTLARVLASAQALDEDYLQAKDLGLITGGEMVRIRGEELTADEARSAAFAALQQAVSKDATAQFFFSLADYESSFQLSHEAERDAHEATSIYEALLAQAEAGLKRGRD